jgi:hypothetical protein
VKAAAAFPVALEPDDATVGFYDALANGKTEACALFASGFIKLFEDHLLFFLRDTRPMITYLGDGQGFFSECPNCYFRVLGTELDCIGKQVDEELSNPSSTLAPLFSVFSL